MAAGKERYFKNVIYVGGGPALKEGYGIMYLLGTDGLMYYYEYELPINGEVRNLFMREVMTHCTEYDGKMRIGFIFASNIVHTLSQIIHPQFIGMDAELPPLDEGGAGDSEGLSGEEMPDGDELSGDGSYSGEDGQTQEEPVLGLAGTENVPHEAVGSVESIADTPIPFELWLFSIKKLGQNFAAATQNYERLSDDEKDALMKEYNDTFGF